MRKSLPVLLGLACVAPGVWFVAGTAAVQDTLTIALAAFYFLVLSFGACWMFYTSTRYEEKPLLFVFLALVPSTFVWYYFERVWTGKVRRDSRAAMGCPNISIPIFALAVGVMLLSLWLEAEVRDPAYFPAFALVTLPMVGHSVGLLWMVYTVIRYEERISPYIFIALIPFAFLWYYFSRVATASSRKSSPRG